MNYEYQKLRPFCFFVLQNFPFIEADFDALTNWQLFCKLGKEINKVIDSVNQSGVQVQNLTTAFNSLYDYVSNYFDTLDVQDEVNNKLDEMAQDGTLAEIVTEYLNVKGLLCFNTIAELENAENLIDGSFVKTYGKNNYLDGEGRFYKVRQILNTDVIDGFNIVGLANYPDLIAEIIPDKYINDINSELQGIENDIEDLQSEISENKNLSDKKYNFHLYGITTNATNEYPITQGGCLVDENIAVFIQSKENNDMYVKKMNLVTGNVIDSVYHTDLSHGQSICYNEAESKLIVTGYDAQKLVVLNSNTLATLSTINLNFYPLAIAYDEENDIYYVSEKSTYTIHVLNSSFVEQSTITIDYIIEHPRNMIDMTFKNGKLYAINNYAIFEIDLLTGKVKNYIEYDKNVDFIVNLSELEFFDIYDKKIVVGAILYPSLIDHGWGNLNSIFAYCDLENNNKIINSTTGGWSNGQKTVYVDNTNVNYLRDGTSEKPFINIYEAVNSLNAGHYKIGIINLKDDYDEERPLIVIGSNAEYIRINCNSKTIAGCYLDYGANVNLADTPVITASDFSIYFSNQTNCIFALDRCSKLTMNSGQVNIQNGSIYNNIGCYLKIHQLINELDWTKTANGGEIQFKNTFNGTTVNPTSSTLGVIHNLTNFINESSDLTTYAIKLPSNGGTVNITFRDGTKEQLVIGSFTGSVGSGSISASITGYGDSCQATITTSKAFRFMRLLTQ